MMQETQCDVLVVGGGGAALRAALAASQSGASVVVALKGRLGSSGATAYHVSEMAGFNVPDGVKDPKDNPEAYYLDIMNASAGMADESLARVVSEQAIGSLQELESWGVPFKRDEDGYFAFLSCFASRRRTHVIPGHGGPVIKALLEQLSGNPVTFMEQSMVLDLIVHDNTCHGAWILDSHQEIRRLTARAVILATGGAGQAFRNNMNPVDITGDGYALGYRAGARLVNMEFMQVGIGIIHPVISLINAYIWGGLPRIRDSRGQDAVANVTPESITTEDVLMMHRRHFPFSSSYISKYLELGIQEAVVNGNGSPHGGVYCDFRHMTDSYIEQCSNEYGIHEMWPLARDFFQKRGANVMEDVMEIACFAHAINGGLLIDPQARTSIDGLYAAGETAGGPHGADRLGGNMMVTCQIFGRIAGESAARYARDRRDQASPDVREVEPTEIMDRILYKKADSDNLIRRLQILNQNHLMIRRSEKGLNQLLMELDRLERALTDSPDGTVASTRNMELLNLITTSRIMAASALDRKESRGSHYRLDYPDLDVKADKPITIIRGAEHEQDMQRG